MGCSLIRACSLIRPNTVDYMVAKLGNGSSQLNCGPRDMCCTSAGLNIRPLFGCGRRLG